MVSKNPESSMVPKTISLEYAKLFAATIIMVTIPKVMRELKNTGVIKSDSVFFPLTEYLLLGMEAASHMPRNNRNGLK